MSYQGVLLKKYRLTNATPDISPAFTVTTDASGDTGWDYTAGATRLEMTESGDGSSQAGYSATVPYEASTANWYRSALIVQFVSPPIDLLEPRMRDLSPPVSTPFDFFYAIRASASTEYGGTSNSAHRPILVSKLKSVSQNGATVRRRATDIIYTPPNYPMAIYPAFESGLNRPYVVTSEKNCLRANGIYPQLRERVSPQATDRLVFEIGFLWGPQRISACTVTIQVGSAGQFLDPENENATGAPFFSLYGLAWGKVGQSFTYTRPRARVHRPDVIDATEDSGSPDLNEDFWNG